MAHPFFWAKKSYFYAIGNTAPVCLTQDLPDGVPAKVLLLGCGDPRNILFTLHISGADTSPAPRPYDFTCCDIEPGVLARNIILYTLLFDDKVPIETIWNIVYHMKLDANSYEALIKQCQKLVDYATDCSTWKNSPYGDILRMTTESTLSELLRYWQLYILSQQWSRSKKKAFSQGIDDTLKLSFRKNDSNLTGTRNAGPLFPFAVKVVGDHFRHYWKTGVTHPSDSTNLPHINPTFAFSLSGEDGWPLHYGSDPILSFHLAEPFILLENPKAATQQDLSISARRQFKNWCISFKSITQKAQNSLIIRFAIADVLSFTRALQYNAVTGDVRCGVPTTPWSATELVLNPEDYGPEALTQAPLSFNLIDTSNLMDHVGLLNLLVSTAPLLSQEPYSSLLTEALLHSSGDGNSGFSARACTDVATLSLLLGLVPLTYITDFTTNSDIHEVLGLGFLQTDETRQFHQRIAWKVPFTGDEYALGSADAIVRPLTFVPQQLAALLFDVYIRMFKIEDPLLQWQRGVSMAIAQEMSITHYTRESYVAFLRLVKQRVSTDWLVVMDNLYDLILQDRSLIMGMNNHQELCCQMHIYDVYTVDALRGDNPIPGTDKGGSRLENWTTFPPVVCLVLEVPRHHLKPIQDTDKVGTPHLQLELSSDRGHSVYASLTGTFGTLRVEGEGEDAIATIEPDPKRWNGTAPLILSCWVTAWTLTFGPSELAIRLSIKSTPQASMLVPVLGLGLSLFECNAADTRHVHVFSNKPNICDQLGKYAAMSYGRFQPTEPTDVQGPVAELVRGANENPDKVSTLMIKLYVKGEALKDFTNGAKLSAEQVGPCTMRITFPGFTRDVSYPYPINGANLKLRISRKSAYVEVIVPLSGHREPGGYGLNLSPVFNRGDVISPWNLHHIDISRLPRIDTLKKAHLNQWLNTHISLSFSDRERDLRSIGSSGSRDPLVELKDSLYTIIIGATGLQSKEKCRVVGLSDPTQGGVYTLIFILGIYLDLSAHTVVVDAFVLPLTELILSKISKGLQHIEGMLQVVTQGDEITLWKRLIPAAVERCRIWKHHPEKCEYMKEKRIPLTTDYDGMPICSCGRGIGTSAFKKVAKWKDFAPYVTRAAFSPLFAVSYLDPVGQALGSKLGDALAETKAAGAKTTDTGKGKAKVDDFNTCAWCGKGPQETQLLLCSRCRSVKYCSQSCQKSDWKLHKAQCK